MPTDTLTSTRTPTVPVSTVFGTWVATIRLKLEAYNLSIKARTAARLVDAQDLGRGTWLLLG